jgi:hypothetical protein
MRQRIARPGLENIVPEWNGHIHSVFMLPVKQAESAERYRNDM